MALALFATVLAWTRLTPLAGGLQHDEAYAILTYIDRGADGIFFGAYEPNDHVLFNLLSWLTVSGLGRSEALYRLPSVLPALAAAERTSSASRERHSPALPGPQPRRRPCND